MLVSGQKVIVINPLLVTPFNTKLVYVMAKTHDGCDVYMPVDSDDDSIIMNKKKELIDYFASIGAGSGDAPLLAQV